MKPLLFLRRRPPNEGGFSHNLIAGGKIVQCKLYGYLTRPILNKVLLENKRYIDKLAAKNLPTLLVTDVTSVTGASADARRDLQKLTDYTTIDRSAIFGANPFMTLLTQYLMRISNTETKVFRTKRQATDWLLGRERTRQRIVTARILAIIVAIAGALVLYGWIAQNEAFKSLGFTNQPRNPVVALSLLLAGISALLLTRKNRVITDWIVRLAGLGLVVFGVLIVAREFFGIYTPADQWPAPYFPGQVLPPAPTIVVASIGLTGMLLILTTTSLKGFWEHLFRGAVILAILVIAYAFIQQAFGDPQTLILGGCGAMLLIDVAIIMITHREPSRFPIAYKLASRYWLGGAVFVLMFAAVLLFWQLAQSVARASELNRIADAVTVEFGANVDVLRGYKALYQSSSFVSAKEFDNYLTESGLQQNYPALSVIGFLQNTSSPSTPSYPLTYLTPMSKRGNYGLDLATHPPTLQLLNEARDSGIPVGNDHINAPSISPDEARGLFIAEALYSGPPQPRTVAERQASLYGFVVTQFNYDKFFENFFQKYPASKNVALVVSDDNNPNEIHYQSETAKTVKDRRIALTRSVKVAGHRIDLSILAGSPVATGLFEGPNIILIAGFIISLLMAAAITLLSHRRHEALRLAEAITEDLEKERSNAVAAAQQDEVILAGIGDGLVTTDRHGKITLVNDRFRELFGLGDTDVMGKYLTDIAPMLDTEGGLIPNSQRMITKVLRQNKKKVIMMHDNILYRRRDGSTFLAAGTITPMTRDGKIVGAVEIVRDVTVEASIDRAKTEFVSLASHQLRTPLTAAKWYYELMLQEDGKLRPKQRAYIHAAYTAVLRTIKLVSSLLNLSRLEMGNIAIGPEHIEITKLSRELVKELSSQVKDRHLKFQEHYPEKIMMNADPRLIRIMLENLLTNAIKYTPDKGLIVVSIVKEHRDIFIEVRDTGYGIPKYQQEKIFTKLFRADNIRAKSTEGTGLGLYLVKLIVSYAEGEVWFESVENEGTTFHIRLPASGMKQRSGPQILV